jgi:hypothetical protein
VLQPPKIQELIPLVFPLKIKGECHYIVTIDRYTPSLDFKGGLERDQFIAVISQDLYPITMAY